MWCISSRSIYSRLCLADINIEFIRSRFPYAIDIASGSHATEFEEDCLKTFNSFIIVEGEGLILQAISDLMDTQIQKKYL